MAHGYINKKRLLHLTKFSEKALGVLVISMVLIAAGVALKRIFHINPGKLLKSLFMLEYLPDLSNHASYGLIFVFGVLTSIHCLGMCGGIVMSQCVGVMELKEQTPEKRAYKWLVPSMLYNFGRIASYTVLGGIVGGLGHIISFPGTWKGTVPIIGGIFLIIMAINLWGIFPLLRRFNIRMPFFLTKKMMHGTVNNPLYVGLLSGLMPCGPLQIVQLYALGTRSIMMGAVSMFVFSVGTLPILFVFGALSTLITKKNSIKILRLSAVVVLLLGMGMIGRGLALAGISLPFLNHGDHEQSSIAQIEEISTNREKEVPSCSMMQDAEVKTEAFNNVHSKNCNSAKNGSFAVGTDSAESGKDPLYKSPDEGTSKITDHPETKSNTNKTDLNQPGSKAPTQNTGKAEEKSVQKIQTLRAKIESGSYPSITVQKNIPVKWILIADENDLNECNNAIVIPKLKIEKNLEAGENIIEFTPDKTGEIIYTCWMGMIKSKIKVVEQLK
ncbi:MAG: sulfite exporter TauE/SafE family protein [Clostridia bacterium]|nr:sulfite exporter TauE/SafE family protein [Clostridia bacterium]